jgi:hypothetical protein
MFAVAAETWSQTLLPQKSDYAPPSTVARKRRRP